MNTFDQRRRRFRRRMKALLFLGLFLSVAGACAVVFIDRKVDSLEQDRKRARDSQFRVNVSLSRNHHPHNSYLAWGPQTVTSGYVGPDLRHIYEQRKDKYRSFAPIARQTIFAGLAIALLTSAVLVFVRGRRVGKPDSESLEVSVRRLDE